MKHVLISFFLFTALFTATPCISSMDSPARMSDQAAIVEVVQRYIKGGRAGKSALMKPAFHEDAKIYSVTNGNLRGGPIKTLFDSIDKGGPSFDLIGEIRLIDISHTTAVVRLELYNWGGARFTDQFALLKVAGQWKIMTKIYYKHRE